MSLKVSYNQTSPVPKNPLKSKPMLQSQDDKTLAQQRAMLKSDFQGKFKTPMSVSSTSSAFFNSLPLSNSVTHKDYVKNLVLNKFYKKYGQPHKSDFFTQTTINNEVLKFIKKEQLNKDSLKELETRIQNLLNNRPQNQSALQNYKVSDLSNSKYVNYGQQRSQAALQAHNSQGMLPQLRQNSQQNLLNLQLNDEQELEDRVKSGAIMNLEPDLSERDEQKKKGMTGYLSNLQPIYVLSQVKEKDRDIKENLKHENEWAEVDEYRQLIYDREKLQLKQKKEQQKAEVKQQLDQQVREKQQRKKEVVKVKHKTDDMIREQVINGKKQDELEKARIQSKVLLQKAQRDVQLKEFQLRKNEELQAKKLYEQDLVNDIKKKLQEDREREVKKRQDNIQLAEEMKKENETNKALRMEMKQKQKELDVKLAQDYINLINDQEKKKREEVERREKRVADFMNKMEASVIAEENKKAKFLEDNIKSYEQKREKEDYLEEERRKKKLLEKQEQLRQDLRNQIEEKRQKKKFNKEMNNEYVQIFRDKVQRDQEKERREIEALREKSKQVQNEVMHQIEEKKLRQKGMTKDEFDFNKDLLKEIITKKKELEQDIKFEKTMQIQKEIEKPKPTYEVYNF